MSKRKEKAVSGLPVMWESKGGNIVVLYSQFDMGEKYKLKRRIRFNGKIDWEYVESFGTLGEAVAYGKFMYDRIKDL